MLVRTVYFLLQSEVHNALLKVSSAGHIDFLRYLLDHIVPSTVSVVCIVRFYNLVFCD